MVQHVKDGRGTVGALVMDEAVYDDLQEMLRDLKHNPGSSSGSSDPLSPRSPDGA